MAKLNDALDRHGVVHRDTDTRIRGMTGNINDFVFFGLGDKLLLERSVPFDPEVDIDSASERLLGPVDVIAI